MLLGVSTLGKSGLFWPACLWEASRGAQAQPDQPTEAQQINRGSPQPLPNYTHWAGSHFGYFACSDTSDQKKQKDSILELQENVGML